MTSVRKLSNSSGTDRARNIRISTVNPRVTHHADMLQFEIITELAEFKALEADWQTLYNAISHKSYFQNFEYLLAAWQCVAHQRGRSLKLIVGRQRGAVVIIWPLVTFSQRHGRWLGSEKCEYRDVLISPSPDANDWLRAAWEYIRSELDFNWVLLQDVRQGSTLGVFLDSNAIVARKVTQPSRFLDCGTWENWEEFWASRSKNLRSDQKRQWRRMADLGPVEFNIIHDRPAVRGTINWMLGRKIEWLDRSGLEERSFKSSENRDFLITTAENAFDTGNLLLATLSVKGEPVAVVYSLIFREEMSFI